MSKDASVFGSAAWFAAAQAAISEIDTGTAALVLEHQLLPDPTDGREGGGDGGSEAASSEGTGKTASGAAGALRYRLTIAAGKATIAALPAASQSDPPGGARHQTHHQTHHQTQHQALPAADITLIQSAATAAKIRSGQMGALTAIQSGQIEIQGDVRKLLAAAEAVAAVDEALACLAFGV